LTSEKLKGMSQPYLSIIKELGSKIKWQHSDVTNDKVYYVYKAENNELTEEHAKQASFLANSIRQVTTTISPASAEQSIK
jgi:hypothetical protein